MLKVCFIFLFLLNVEMVKSQNPIAGCYSSNFAIIGWFGSQLKFNEDQSFHYLFAGDLFYDKITGTYEVVDKYIFLSYPKITDSLEITMTDSLGNLVTHRFPNPENNAANYRPSKLKIKSTRLVIYDHNGKRVRRKMNAREKWRKYYLIKIPCD